MSSYWFGLAEAILVVGLAVAFYVWQMATLKRDVKAREEREAREVAAKSAAPSPSPGHPERQHQLDET